MTKEEITALARKHGTSYTNRHAPSEPAFAFGNESWAAFCDALVAIAQPAAIEVPELGAKWAQENAAYLASLRGA